MSPESTLPTSRIEHVGAYSIRVVEAGSGPHILFIHGMDSSAQTWTHQIQAFSHTHHVFAPDLPGCGLSEKPLNFPYTPTAYSLYLRDFCRHFKIDRAIVVGHSLGGAIAEQFARDWPSLVEKLILIAPSDLKAGLRKIRTKAINNILLFSYFDKQKIPRDIFVLNQQIRATPNAQECRQMIKDANSYPSSMMLGEITIPTLIIWGENDEILPLSQAEDLFARFPNLKTANIQMAGHACHEECPDEVNHHISGFHSS